MKDRPALIVAPYDAELFGHWWFEGPQWLDFLFRKMHFDQQTIKCITVPEYLEKHPNIQHCRPVMSSWGNNGYSEVWLEASNDWIYMHLHACADRMEELASNNLSPDPINLRALNQALRELLLAQSSDWAFIIKAGTTVDYAVNRTRMHILNFLHLYEQITEKKIDESWLAEVEARHNLFPNIDYRVFSSVNYQYGGN
jgi:1,4-alpha-glucan branching enzyme